MTNNNTLWLLLGMYEGKFLIPVEQAVNDHFQHLTPAKFVRKVLDGDIKLPIITPEDSQRAAKMVDLRDLASYLDGRRQEAHDKLAKLRK